MRACSARSLLRCSRSRLNADCSRRISAVIARRDDTAAALCSRAWAAAAAGVRCLVVMPESASPTKIRASREYGAEVILHGDAKAAFTKVFELSEERGMTFVHPFDDEEVVAGHGSCGLEIVDQLPGVHTIVVPVGGGGLSSAIATSVAAAKPGVAVWGVEPEGAPSMHRSLQAGEAIHLESVSTVADGLAPPMAGVLNHELLAAHARGVVLVSDHQIIRALRFIVERTKLLVAFVDSGLGIS